MYNLRGRDQSPRPSRQAPTLVQRQLYVQNAYGWGGSTDSTFTFLPWADIAIDGGSPETRWFNSDLLEEVEVSPTSSGKIVLHTLYWYLYHKAYPRIAIRPDDRELGGPFRLSVTVTFKVDKDGKVTFGQSLPEGEGDVPGGGGPDELHYRAIPLVLNGDGEGTAGIAADLEANEHKSKSGSQGTEVSMGGGVSVTVGKGWGASRIDAGHWIARFGVHLKVKRKAPVAKMPSIVSKPIFYGEEGRLGEGKFLSGDDGIDGLREWWLALPRPVRNLIMAGTKKVQLAGHASKTGTSKRNVEVVHERLEEVKSILRGLTPGVQFLEENLAASAAVTPGPSRNERRVDVTVEYTDQEANPP
jgi:hypothetical protein